MLFQKNRIYTFQKNRRFNSHFGLCSSHSRALNSKALDAGKSTRVLDPWLCSTLTKSMSGQGPASWWGPRVTRSSQCLWLLSLHSLCDQGGPPLLFRAPAKGDSTAITTGWGGWAGKQRLSQQSAPFLRNLLCKPAYTGTFAEHPISVNLIIFLNMLQEEISRKRSVWNLSVKGKLCCYSKKSFFI